ncbi:MAG: prephenate dehydratase [Gammaproteobacteria bacterium]|nr:prephenate dehydratase [Gammaproteobacteria bacterium]
MSDDALRKVRENIDRIDRQLQELITERAKCACEVARIKQVEGDTSEYYRPEREAQVLETVRKRNQGPLEDEAMVRLFREIMSTCLHLQHPMSVAYLGPQGTFTEAAARKHFGHAVEAIPLAGIDAVFREVEAGSVHYGVVPIENSTEGVVNHTLDLFVRSPLKICSEIELRIHHNLMGRQADLGDVHKVYGHQMALAQCRNWLDTHLPRAERIAVSSNAEAAVRSAKDAAEGRLDSAAIAGKDAAGIYDLMILANNIEDAPDNTTRFLVIGRSSPKRSGHDKTSLMLATTNKSGALVRLLEPLARRGISLSRIESRPSHQGTWEYLFFVDITGHVEDDKVIEAINELEKETTLVKVLGSYPKAII